MSSARRYLSDLYDELDWTRYLFGYYGALAIISVVLMLALPAHADGPRVMPDPALTPGVVASTDLGDICSKDAQGLTYSRRHRHTTQAMKREVLRRYGIVGKFVGEIDHREPICAGGADVVENLWTQQDFHEKDKLEAFACREICAHRIPLAEAQSWFLGDWRQQLWRVEGKPAPAGVVR